MRFQQVVLEQFSPAVLPGQLRRVRLTLGFGFVVSVICVIGVYSLSQATGVPLAKLTRDPATVTNSYFYVGILSNLGILLWSASTAICFFGALLLNSDQRSRQSTVFLFCSGLICLLLTLDDTFLFHEEVFPTYLKIPEAGVYLIYMVILAGYFFYFLPNLLSTDYLLLIVAGFFLGASIFIDAALPFSNTETFVEDCLKFSGIVFLLGYFSHTTAAIIRRNYTDAASEPSAPQ